MMSNNNTTKYLNSLYPYFKMLNNINNDLNQVIKNNTNNEPYQNEELFYNITSELLRLLPYKYKKATGKITLDEKSGILLLQNSNKIVKEKYNKIINFDRYNKVLKDIITIRNKYIHEPHNISYAFSVGGTSICSMSLYYKTELLSISTISLTPIVYYLNKIFEQIKNDAMELLENDVKYKDYPYYDVIANYDFSRKKWHYTILPEYLIIGF